MDFRQGGQGPRRELSSLLGLALLMCFLCIVTGCSQKRVAAVPVPSPPLQQAVAEPALQQAVIEPVLQQQNATPAAPARETDFSSFMPRATGYFTLSFSEYDYDEFLPEDTISSESYEDIGDVPSISDVVMSQYDDWRGVRYRPGGSDYRGVDCSGLVQAIFRDAFEMDLPRTSIEQSKMGEAVAREEIQPGDLLYFVDRGRKHVGVAVNENQFVHASRKKGVILSKFDKYWTPRLLRIRRLLDEKDRNAFAPTGG
jgi:cell wall-associated NlpC family hydrolase